MKSFIIISIQLVCLILSWCIVAPVRAESYRVGDGDILEITVYDHPEMTATVRVSADGIIIVPLLDHVQVAGMTTGEIARKLRDLLADGYIVNPQVNVFVKEYRDQKAVILGQVKSPGLYPLRDRTTLLELISQAGGLTEEAGHVATLKREGGKEKGGQAREIVIDLDKLVEQGDSDLNIPIMDGDRVFITKAGLFYVTGEVKKPDSYKYQDDLTIIKGIAMAGGFTDIADKGGVKIVRKIDGKEKIIEVSSMDEKIQPDDVIVVPESFF